MTDILQQLVNLEISDDERVGGKIRAQVFKSLCSLNESRFEAEALQLLKDSEEQIKKVRLQEYRAALGEKEESIKELLILLADDYSNVRYGAATALGKLGNGIPQVVSVLLADLRYEDSAMVREYAAITLGELGNGSPQVVEPLLIRLGDEDSTVAKNAANSLAELGKNCSDITSTVIEWISQHQDTEYVGNGIDALWMLVGTDNINSV